MMLLASGVNFGYKKTLRHLAGISIGHFIMLMAVGNGLEAIFTVYPITYQIMKIIGLILGILGLSSKATAKKKAEVKKVDAKKKVVKKQVKKVDKKITEVKKAQKKATKKKAPKKVTSAKKARTSLKARAKKK